MMGISGETKSWLGGTTQTQVDTDYKELMPAGGRTSSDSPKNEQVWCLLLLEVVYNQI